MRAKKQIDGQALEESEGLHIVFRNLWIVLVADQHITVVDIWTADNYSIQLPSRFIHLHRPSGTSFRVTGRQARRQFRTAEFNRVSIVQYAVDVSAWTTGCGALYIGNVRVHNHQSRASFLLDHTCSRIVISMSVADEKDLRIGLFEAELLDALSYRRHVFRKIRVNENVPLRRADQVSSEIGCTDVIEVAGDLECRECGMPVRVRLRQERRCENQERYEACTNGLPEPLPLVNVVVTLKNT